MDQVIELNVNEYMAVLRSTLCCMEECILSNMFASKSSMSPRSKDSKKRYFLQYNNNVFKFIVEYLKQYETRQSHESMVMSENMLRLVYQCPFDELMKTLDHFNLSQAKDLIFDQDPLYNNYFIKISSNNNNNNNNSQNNNNNDNNNNNNNIDNNTISLSIISNDTLLLMSNDKLIKCAYIRNSVGIRFRIPSERQSNYTVYFDRMPGDLEGWHSCYWERLSHPPTKMEDPQNGPQKCSVHRIFSTHLIQMETRYTDKTRMGTYTTFDCRRYYLVEGHGPSCLDDAYALPSGTENGKYIESKLI